MGSEMLAVVARGFAVLGGLFAFIFLSMGGGEWQPVIIPAILFLGALMAWFLDGMRRDLIVGGLGLIGCVAVLIDGGTPLSTIIGFALAGISLFIYIPSMLSDIPDLFT